MNNAITAQAQRPQFSALIASASYKKVVNNALQDPAQAKRFVSAITSAVAVNPALQECDPATILSGALLGESLGLSPSPQLGQYYLVPYWNKKKGCNDAQFQLGYKGYVQLALRSGYYKRLNVLTLKDGELKYFNPVTEEFDVKLMEDVEVREALPSTGYLAMFEFKNGFQKVLYWSKDKMVAHADRYSPAFSKDAVTLKNGKKKVSFADYEAKNYPTGDEWLYSSFWYKEFDQMAQKTMLRQLISKWGVMSIDLQTAFEEDTKFENNPDYQNIPDLELPAPMPDISQETTGAPTQETAPQGEPLKELTLDDL